MGEGCKRGLYWSCFHQNFYLKSATGNWWRAESRASGGWAYSLLTNMERKASEFIYIGDYV